MSKFRPNNNNNNGSQPQQRKQPVAITGPSAMVQQMAQRNFAMRNGGQLPPAMQGNGVTPAVATVNPNIDFFANGNGAVGKYDAPVQNGNAPQTDFTNMPSTPQFNPQGAGNANPTVGPVASPYMNDAAVTTQQPQSNFEGMQQPQQFEVPSLQEHSDVGYKGGPYDPSKYDSLSAALNDGASGQSQQQVPEFQSDPNQRDGGFFGWLKGLMPKARPGMREGETPDEYDRRMTSNMERLATLADAFRHMGNIINTAKGAPLQQFNDPTSMMEQGYQQRKQQRAQKAAADADAAYKQANLTLKERAAKADRAYKQLSLGYKDAADKRAQRKFEYQVSKDAAAAQRQAEQDQQKQSNWENQFRFRQQQAAISNGLRQQSINKRGSGKSGGGGRDGSGSGAAYSLYNPNTGKTEYFKNNNEFLRRAGELGYDTSKPTSESTSQEIISKDGTKKVTKTNRGTSVNAKIGQQEAQKKKQNANKNARKGSKLKNTSALGL